MTAGFEQVPAALHLDKTISPAARALYPVLKYLHWSRSDGREFAELSEDEIAETFGTSRNAVRGYIRELIAAGWMRRTRASKNTPMRYWIHEVSTGSESAQPLGQNLQVAPLSTDTADITNPSGWRANDLVASYVDRVKAAGAPAPKRTIGIVAKNVKELLDEGVDPAIVNDAIGLMVDRRLHPSTLPTLILEAAAGPRSRLGHGGSEAAFDVAMAELERIQAGR